MIHIIDIDTTIADNSHRASFLVKTCKQCLGQVPTSHRAVCQCCGSTEHTIDQSSWDVFLDADMLAQDIPEPEAQRVVSGFVKHGVEHHYLTGRNESLREVTETWLTMHFGFDEERSQLIMRPFDAEDVPASSYKEQAFRRLKSEVNNPESGFIFYEDDPFVFSMYEKYGMVLKCPEAWPCVMPPGASRRNEAARNV